MQVSMGFAYGCSPSDSQMWANYGPYESDETERMQTRLEKMLSRSCAEVFRGGSSGVKCVNVSVRVDGETRYFPYGRGAKAYIASLAV